MVVVINESGCFMLGRVYAEMLNRQQNHLQLVVFDIDCFIVNDDTAEGMMHDAGNSISTPGSVWIVQDETSNYWVNVSICLTLPYIYLQRS